MNKKEKLGIKYSLIWFLITNYKIVHPNRKCEFYIRII